MEGSTPEWARAEDYATLEDVFTSRSFGHPVPEDATEAVPAVALAAAAAMAPKPYFAGSRIVASIAVAAAAVAGVAGLTVGTRPKSNPVVSAQPPSGQPPGPANVPDFRTPPPAATPAPTGGAAPGTGGTAGSGAKTG